MEELTHWKRLWCWEGLGAEEKGMTEDEMAGWHHWLDGRESEWTPGVSDGQGGLACGNSGGRKESDMTEQLNWRILILSSIVPVPIPTNSVEGSPFFPPSSVFTVCRLFWWGLFWTAWGDTSLQFWFAFSNNQWYQTSFHRELPKYSVMNYIGKKI